MKIIVDHTQEDLDKLKKILVILGEEQKILEVEAIATSKELILKTEEELKTEVKDVVDVKIEEIKL